MSLDLKKIQNEYEKTAEEIEKSLTESKESFGSVKKSLDEGFSIFQNEIEGKFLSFTGEYQSLLDTFSDDFSFKSESLEKGIADIDVIKQSLENSLKEISAKVLGDFSDFTDEQASSLQKT